MQINVYPESKPGDGQTLIEAGKRYAIETLVERWVYGEKKPLNSLLSGFQKLQSLHSTDERSFEYIAGIHGRSFITRSVDVNPIAYWGGWCHHVNVLFPVWHRAYILYLEKALRSVTCDETLMMAYWDEIGQESRKAGVPEIFTADFVWIDGQGAANPLKCFTFNMRYLVDNPTIPTSTNYQEITYTTVKFPFFHSYFEDGAKVAEDDEKQIAVDQLNRRYTKEQGLQILNKNVEDWIGEGSGNMNRDVSHAVYEEYLISLNCENYTVFSNTQSAKFEQSKTPDKHIFSLERPHNHVHLAVGALTPDQYDKKDFLQAFGDMVYNELAGFDPIFYFHHAFIDLVFWKWQVIYGAAEKLDVDPTYPGTSTSGHKEQSQGPTPNLDFSQLLDMETPLNPFKDNGGQNYLTGNSMTNISKLGYDYVEKTPVVAMKSKEPKPNFAELIVSVRQTTELEQSDFIRVYNIDRTLIAGPFTIAVYLKTTNDRFFVGRDSVFNRLASMECDGCMSNRYMEFYFPPRMVNPNVVYNTSAEIEVDIRGHVRHQAKLDFQSEFTHVNVATVER